MGPGETNELLWTLERASLPGHRIVQQPFATWVHSDRPVGLRSVHGCRFDADSLDEQIETILRSYQAEGSYANWMIGPTATPPGLALHIRRKYRLMGPMYLPAMELDLANAKLPEAAVPCMVIEDWDAVLEQGHPTAQWFAKAQRKAIGAMMREIAALGNAIYCVCYADGRLAGAATAFIDEHHVAGIYDVVVKEEFRGQGLGTAITAFALRQAIDRDCRLAVLQSHKKAVGLYERLGFVENGQFASLYYSRTRSASDAEVNGIAVSNRQ